MELEFKCKYTGGCDKTRPFGVSGHNLFYCIENGKVCEYLEAKKGV